MANTTGRSRPVREKTREFVRIADKGKYPVFDHSSIGPETNVLVFAPHQDDEIIGCGGTISKFGKLGAHVKVVYLTGYGLSDRVGDGKNLTKIDKSEADIALRALHCFDSEIINPKSKRVHVNAIGQEHISAVIDQMEPDMLFVPNIDESNTDYLTTVIAIANGLIDYERDLTCFCFSFKRIKRPNIMVDITDNMDDKIEAIRELRSQSRTIEDSAWLKEMNRYQLSSNDPKERFCEYFVRYKRKEFLDIIEELGYIKR